MANPRKFSEKIALQKQKQAEGTAEFEKIMKEVYATKMDEGQASQRVEENCIGSGNGLSSSYRESRGRSVGVGPMRRPSDRRTDRSPYSSANIAFLSPPSDSNWRRTNSDSAIHQSLQLTQEKHHGSHSPISLSPTTQRRTAQNSTNSDYMNAIAMSGNKNVSNMELRQGFETDINNTYKSLHDNALFNVMANTGSLPDLTSVHFSTPINTTLEKEQQHSSSPFSSGQLTTSPTVLSPVTMCNRFQSSPAHSPSDSLTYSPTHYAANFSQDNQFNQYRQTQNDQQTSHLSFTNLPGLINNQQGNGKNLNISNNNTIHGSHGHLSSIGITAAGNLTEYRNSLGSPSPGSSPGLLPTNKETKMDSSCSPILVYNNKNSQIYNKQNQNNDGYAVNQSFQNHFEQFSLVDNAAPECSQNLRAAQNNYTDVQQQVNIDNNDCLPKIPTPEPQFSEAEFDDALLGRLSNHNLTNQQVPQYHHIRQQNDGGQNCNNIMESGEKNDINVLSILGGNLKLENELTQDSLRSHQFKNQQRANTPTIPAIVFSDFSSGNPDYTKEIFNSLDLELGPMDMAGLQMLSDPTSTMIADPTIEDSFRRDLT